MLEKPKRSWELIGIFLELINIRFQESWDPEIGKELEDSSGKLSLWKRESAFEDQPPPIKLQTKMPGLIFLEKFLKPRNIDQGKVFRAKISEDKIKEKLQDLVDLVLNMMNQQSKMIFYCVNKPM